MNTLSIVIVNWNSGEQLKACVKALDHYLDTKIQLDKVVIVDNASKDCSIQNIEYESLILQVIRNKVNIGFAAACNVGAKECDTEYILFLNPDTIVYGGSLSKIISFMEDKQNHKVGICGAQLLNEQDKVQPSCSRFPTVTIMLSESIGLDKFLPGQFTSQLMIDWAHDESKFVDQVMGAFFLVRRSLFEELGGFDESFFMYFEEVDFAYRANLKGWFTYYFNEAKAFHRGCGTTETIKAQRLFYSLRSRIIYVLKHFNIISAAIVIVTTIILEPISRFAFYLLRLSFEEGLKVIHGYSMLFSTLPSTIRIAINTRSERKKKL
jgi:GT2 family glycosyltransferase